jgi:Tfp pilus assembly protein PilO
VNSLLQNKRNVVALAALGVAAVLAAAWFLAVSPQRSKAASLKSDVAAAEQELTQRRTALATPSAAVKVKASDLYRLTKALPDTLDMAGVLLDVNRLANRHELEFNSLLPGVAEVRPGYLAQPLSLVVQGRFADVSKFMGDLRKLVRVRKGRLDARGRAYSASDVTISEADGGLEFPNVKAVITVQSFTFQAQPEGTAPGSPDTGTTSPNGTVAAGVTP